ncbi:MAG: amino acid ABC transporter permease [Euzebyales bacterium]|nr:amino acid ABC transporter permease [Euzebyales bacterium]
MTDLDFGLVLQSMGVLLRAARISVFVAAAGFAIAVVLGVIVAAMRRSRLRPLSWVAFAYTSFFRGIALYVLIIWLYFGIAAAAGITLGALTAGIATLALLNSAYLAEVFRSGIEAVDDGQREAALAMGLSRGQAFRAVIAPQALRIALPATGNHLVDAIKDSAILLVIGVPELMRETARLAQYNYRPFEFYTVAGAMYLFAVSAVGLLFRWLERRLAWDPAERRGGGWTRLRTRYEAAVPAR